MDYCIMAWHGGRSSESPATVLIDEGAAHKYVRPMSRKGLGDVKEMGCLVQSINEALTSWGPCGSMGNEITIVDDRESNADAAREELGIYRGGRRCQSKLVMAKTR